MKDWHPILQLVVAPLLGAVFCIFLPLIGFALCFEAIWHRLRRRGVEQR